MRFIGLVLAASLLTGCLSVQEKAELARVSQETQEQIAEINDLIIKTRESMQDGTLSLAEGLAALADLNEKKSTASANYTSVQELLAKKPWYEQMEGWGQIILAVAGSLMGVRVARGPSSKPFKNPDGSLK